MANDRDQFLAPKESWENDREFHFNCLVFSLFHGQNRISSFEGVNYFIPFSEKEINAKEAFASDFMYKFLQGKIGKDLAGGVKGNYLDGRSDSGGGSSNLTCETRGDSDSGRLRDSAQNGGAGVSHAFAGGLRGLGRNKESEAEASHLAGDVKESGLEKIESKNIDSSLFESQNETLKLLINLIPQKPVIFSELAQKVMDAGRALFTYYHDTASKPPKFSFDDGYNRSYNANVSLYDIKAHFQGFSGKSGRTRGANLTGGVKGSGLESNNQDSTLSKPRTPPTKSGAKMNPPQKAQDEHYKILLSDLNNALENLADEIAQKCYEHEFLLD